MTGLADPNLKLRRARVHLDALELQCRAFVESKPYRIAAYDDLKTEEYVVEIEFTTPDIWPIGAVAGDLICNLRSSLDHLIYGLVRLGTVVPTSQTGFPIIGTHDGQRTEDRFRNAIRGIPDLATEIVRSLQPYNSGHSYRETFLWRLHELWNMDKHRHIPLDGGACDIQFPRVPHHLPAPKPGIVNDRLVVRFPMISKPFVNVDAVTGVFMRFGSEKSGVVMTIEDLAALYDYLAEKVIPRFVHFFSD
jgi:hypothetical protein